MSGFLVSHLGSLLTVTKAQRSCSALLLFNLFARRLSHCVLKEFESNKTIIWLVSLDNRFIGLATQLMGWRQRIIWSQYYIK